MLKSSCGNCTQTMETIVVNRHFDSYDVYIGRGSKWGNPFVIGTDGGREAVIEKYRTWIQRRPDLLNDLPELVGKRLGCYCKPEACHGDVLVELMKERGLIT